MQQRNVCLTLQNKPRNAYELLLPADLTSYPKPFIWDCIIPLHRCIHNPTIELREASYGCVLVNHLIR